MSDPESPIIDFYPKDFALDLNGKKQEWEAVVKIPFIMEDRLLKAMAGMNNRLCFAFSPDQLDSERAPPHCRRAKSKYHWHQLKIRV